MTRLTSETAYKFGNAAAVRRCPSETSISPPISDSLIVRLLRKRKSSKLGPLKEDSSEYVGPKMIANCLLRANDDAETWRREGQVIKRNILWLGLLSGESEKGITWKGRVGFQYVSWYLGTYRHNAHENALQES